MNVRVDPVIAASLDILKTMAANLHSDQNKDKICPKPILVEIYLPCLVSNEVFNPTPALVVPSSNGH